MIIVLGQVTTRADDFAQALALSQDHVARSRAEPGCIAHAVHQDTENPLCLVFVEQWASQEALFTHFKVPASKAFAKALASLATEPPHMEMFEAEAFGLPPRATSAG
jgi:quinol monooxygenase YgiN